MWHQQPPKKRSNKHVYTCCACALKSNDENITTFWHRFPLNKEYIRQWFERLRLPPDMYIAGCTRVCGTHFKEDRRKLPHHALPEYYNPPPAPEATVNNTNLPDCIVYDDGMSDDVFEEEHLIDDVAEKMKEEDHLIVTIVPEANPLIDVTAADEEQLPDCIVYEEEELCDDMLEDAEHLEGVIENEEEHLEDVIVNEEEHLEGFIVTEAEHLDDVAATEAEHLEGFIVTEVEPFVDDVVLEADHLAPAIVKKEEHFANDVILLKEEYFVDDITSDDKQLIVTFLPEPQEEYILPEAEQHLLEANNDDIHIDVGVEDLDANIIKTINYQLALRGSKLTF